MKSVAGKGYLTILGDLRVFFSEEARLACTKPFARCAYSCRQFIQRCIDTAHDNRGFIVPLADSDLVQMLELVAEGERSQINGLLNGLYNTLLT